MTLGTSLLPLGAASYSGAEAETFGNGHVRAHLQRWRRGMARLQRRLPGACRLSRSLATLYLAAFGALSMTAWSGTPAPSDGMFATLAAGLGQVHVAFLMLAGAGMALVTLRSGRGAEAEPAPQPAAPPLTGLGDLLAQMSHELRTPLNAVIGFSDVMRHELHGPLGNARYQEYAAHISESGGRMLKSSQEALAVAEAMTVLLARQPQARQERLMAGPIVREAWRRVGSPAIQLDVVTCNACDIGCEPRATAQALEHLLREASSRVGGEGRVEVVGSRHAAARSVCIRVGDTSSFPAPGCGTPAGSPYPPAQPGGLNTLLARLLIEAQGARLDVTATDEAWLATITFERRRAA